MKKLYTQIAGGGSEYLAPEVTVFEIRVEAGFTTSSGGTEELPEEGEVDPWS